MLIILAKISFVDNLEVAGHFESPLEFAFGNVVLAPTLHQNSGFLRMKLLFNLPPHLCQKENEHL